MKTLLRKLAWLQRTFFCTIWIISGLCFVVTSASGLAETDNDAANALMIQAGYFGGIMLIAMLAHAYLITQHKKEFPHEEDKSYPDFDL